MHGALMIDKEDNRKTTKSSEMNELLDTSGSISVSCYARAMSSELDFTPRRMHGDQVGDCKTAGMHKIRSPFDDFAFGIERISQTPAVYL
jgi:hypothetical protein